MASAYTKYPEFTFNSIQFGAGILCETFDPATSTVTNIIGATSGGFSFSDTINMVDRGEDIDNVPKNTLELADIDDRDVVASGTFVTITPDSAKSLMAAADIDPEDATHVIPRDNLKSSDFKTMWFVGDYSDVTTGNNAGHVAIMMRNMLNTNGFAMQTQDKGKGTFAYNYKAFYSLQQPDQMPYEVYIKRGTSEANTDPAEDTDTTDNTNTETEGES